MIFKILDNLREKPEPVRRQVAVILSGFIMGIIVFVWAAITPSTFSGTANKESDTTSPFSVLKEQGKVFYDSTVDSVSAARDTLDGNAFPAAAALFGEEATTSPEEIPPVSDDDALVPDLYGDSYF